MTAPAGRAGFEPSRAGKRAECDGGFVGTDGGIGREEFAGTLTGEFVEHGDPPSRWCLLVDLTRKPPNYPWDGVWCEQSFLFLVDEPAPRR